MNLALFLADQDRDTIEKWCRSQTQQAYLGDHIALARVLGKFLMYVDTWDLSLTPHMLMNGFWELWVTQAIAAFVKPGMRCIDVGANCGYYTLLLAELSGNAPVHAYEPQAELRPLIERSALINGFSNTTVFERALGEAVGAQDLHHSEHLLGSASLVPGVGLIDGTTQVTVSTLDVDYAGVSAVSFMKIDVQGYEMQVLRGGRELIARSPNLNIAMEFSPAEHSDPMVSLLEIVSMGFSVRTIGTDGIIRAVTLEQAAKPDTGDHRMLWLSK